MRIPAFFIKILTAYFRYLAIGVVIIILVVGYVLFIRTKVDTLRTSGYLERASVESELASEQDHLKRLKESEAKFRAALPKEKLDAIDSFIPTGTDFPRLMLTIRNIASAANLDLSSISVNESDSVTTAPLNEVPESAEPGSAQAATITGVSLRTQDVSITVSRGQSYETFKDFISKIELSQRLMDVISLQFSHGGEDSEEAGSTYTITLRTYYLPES